MRKATLQAQDSITYELFDLAALTPPRADEPDPPAPEASETPRLLRRVHIDPQALSRAVGLLGAFAVDHGRTTTEQELIAVFVREDDVLLVADLDRDDTRTADGRTRPMRLRFSVPLLNELNEGRARWAGAWVHAQDLLRACRNRVGNSDNKGILTEPVTLEMLLSEDGEFPSEIVVRPADDKLEPRSIRTMGGAALGEYVELEPRAADRGLTALDPDVLIEAGSLAHPDVGVLVQPAPVSGPAHVVAAGPQGLLLATFASPAVAARNAARAAEDGLGQGDLLEGAATPAASADSPEEPFVLTGPAVFSPRLAIAAGLTQCAMEEAVKARQRSLTATHAGHVLAAAIAAALDLDGPTPGSMLAELCAAIGAKDAERALAEARAAAADSVTEQAIAYARRVTSVVPVEEAVAVAQRLRGALDPDGTINAALAEIVREQVGDDVAVATAALGYLAATKDAARLSRETAVVLGQTHLREAARQAIAHTADAGATERIRFSDLAVAAVRIRNKQSGRLTDVLLPMLPAARIDAWWERFEAYMAQLRVPESARAEILARRQTGEAPTTEHLAISADLRESWLRECQVPVQGQFWRAADGRVYAGFVDEEAGAFMLSDLAVQPDPQQYPVTPHDVANALDRRGEFVWRGRLFSNDVNVAANRVVGLENPDRPRPEGAPETEAPGTLFVARWTAPGATAPDGTVLDYLTHPAHRELTEPNTVWLGEGAAARRYRLVRKDDAGVEPARAGTLRVFGFDASGEHLRLAMPMKIAPTVAGDGPVAFAVSADRLHDFVTFVTDKGRQVLLDVAKSTVRFADQHFSRVVVLPTVGATRVPDTLRPLVTAAGVPDVATPVALTTVIDRVRALGLRRPATAIRAEQIAAVRLATPAGKSFQWRPAPRRTAPPGEIIAESVSAAPWWLSREGKVAALNREMMRAQEQLDALLSRQATPLMQGNLFGGDDDTRSPLSIARAIGRLKRRITELQQQKEQLVQVSDDPATAGAMRSGMDRVRIILETADEAEEVDARLFDATTTGPAQVGDRESPRTGSPARR